jgi:hypothetical protein
MIVKTLEKQFKNVLFNEYKLNFYEYEDDSSESSIIEDIVYELPNSFNFNIYNALIDFKSKLESCSRVDEIWIFKNGNIFIKFTDTSSGANLFVIDGHYTLKKSIKLKTLFENGRTFIKFNTFLNEILVIFNNDTRTCISILNQDLVIQERLFISYKQYKSIFANSQNIIALTSDAELDFYSHNLKFIKTLELTFYLRPFGYYFSINSINKSFILTSSNVIRIVNIDSGVEEAFINICDIKIHQTVIKNDLYIHCHSCGS